MKEDDDIRRLRKSRGMIESFEHRIKSYLTTDVSFTSAVLPNTAATVLMVSPTRIGDRNSRCRSLVNPIGESRRLSEQEFNLKRRINQSKKQVTFSPASLRPSIRSDEAVRQIATCNRRSDYRDASHMESKAGKGRYSLVSNLIAKESMAYESRMDHYSQVIQNQEDEIKLLYRELDMVKQASQYVDEYSLPPEIEHKYNMIKYRGKIPSREGKNEKGKNILVEENSPKKSKKSSKAGLDVLGQYMNDPASSVSGSLAPTINPLAAMIGSGLFNAAGLKSSNRTIQKRDPSKASKIGSSSRSKKPKPKAADKSMNLAIPGAHRSDISRVDSDPFTKKSVQILNRAKSRETIEDSHKSTGRVDKAVLNPILNLINSFR